MTVNPLCTSKYRALVLKRTGTSSTRCLSVYFNVTGDQRKPAAIVGW